MRFYKTKRFSGNFNAVCGFLMLFCAVFIRISVQFCGIHTPLRPPQLAQWDLNKSTVNDFFASNLTRSTLLFAILKINNRKQEP